MAPLQRKQKDEPYMNQMSATHASTAKKTIDAPTLSGIHSDVLRWCATSSIMAQDTAASTAPIYSNSVKYFES